MKSKYQLSVIDQLRNLRQERHLSQAQVATTLGISTGQMGNIETPKASHKYTLGQINLLCNRLGISVKDIFLSAEEQKLPLDKQIDLIINNIVLYEQ